MMSEDDQKKYEEMLARGEQPQSATANSNVVWDRESYKTWLESRLLGADAGTRETIEGQLRDLGPKAVVNAQDAVHEAEENADYNTAKNAAFAAAQATVTEVVSAGMSSDSKEFSDTKFKSGMKYSILDLDKNGGFDPNHRSSVDAQELKDAFANLELGKMDTEKRHEALTRINDMLQGKDDLSDEDVMRALNPSLDKLERFKATQILEKDEGEDIAKIKTDIHDIHQYFDQARTQINRIAGMQDNAGVRSDAPQELKASLDQALEESKNGLKATLETVYHKLVDKNFTQYVVSGGVSHDGISSTSPAGKPGSSVYLA